MHLRYTIYDDNLIGKFIADTSVVVQESCSTTELPVDCKTVLTCETGFNVPDTPPQKNFNKNTSTDTPHIVDDASILLNILQEGH